MVSPYRVLCYYRVFCFQRLRLYKVSACPEWRYIGIHRSFLFYCVTNSFVNSRDTQWLLWNRSLPGLSNVVRTATINVDQGANKSSNAFSLPSQTDEGKLLVLLCHQLLEDNRDTQWLLWNHSLPGLSSIVRMAPAKVDQGGNKSNNVCGLHSGFLKFLTRFHKEINPQKSSKDFGVQNPEKSSVAEPPRTATNSQTFREVFRSNLHKFEKIFTKQVSPLDPSAHD